MERIKINEFAAKIAEILKKDRWVFLVCDGEMGEGKSCFVTQLAREVAKITHTPFSYKDNLTFLRSELKTWIDGDKDGKGQKQEHSAIVADELISLFFKRNWFDADQIDGIELLNKCRDRHLFVCGNIPNFWDLDSAIYSSITFRVRIHERGRAWVFMKSRDPFTGDTWFKKDNHKSFTKKKNPYSCHGFVSELIFDDWNEKDKEEYYEVRNTKRKNTEGQRERPEKFRDIKSQRNNLIIALKNNIPGITGKEIADIAELDHSHVNKIINGSERD